MDSPRSRPDLLAAAATAGEVLFTNAAEVDRGHRPVGDNLDILADAGLYGLDAPHDLGGADAGQGTAARVTELLAGGCLTTAFVWIQHRGAMRRVAATGGGLMASLGPGMARGQRRAGVAVGGVRPGRAPLVATRAAGGWRLDGQVPWVTGWGLIDLVLVAARDGEHGDVLWLLVDAPAVDGPGDRLRSAVPTIRLRRIAIAACDHANSAAVAFTGHHVDGDRMLARESFEQWQQADAAGLRTNGHLALGVAGRCATLVAAHRRGDDADSGAASGDDGLAGEIESARTVLASADPPQLPAARAAVAALTWRAAHELLVVEGGRGLGASAHAQRLVREAMLLQVFGSRPSIRDGLLGAIRGGGGRRRPAD